MKEGFTNKEAAAAMGMSVQRWRVWRRRLKIKPSGYWGAWPMFSKAAIQKAKKTHDQAIAKFHNQQRVKRHGNSTKEGTKKITLESRAPGVH